MTKHSSSPKTDSRSPITDYRSAETAPAVSVAIMGAPTSSGNRGVLALASALVNLLSAGRQDVRATMLVGSPTPIPLKTVVNGKRVEIPAINYRHTYKSGLATCLPWIALMSIFYRLLPLSSFRNYLKCKIPWIRCLAEADIVGDVRGGDSFSDIYGMKRYLFGFLCAWTAILVNGKLVQFPQTYGPYKSGLARRIARFLLLRSSVIIARDTKSKAVAEELVAGKKEILLSPDVAFGLEVIPAPASKKPQGKVIGINVNGLMYNGGYDRSNMFGLSLDYPQFLRELITELLSKGHEAIWLVPHTYAPIGDVESDNDACQKVKDGLPTELQDRVNVISEEYDQHEIKGIIGLCDGFLGSRMHSCIAALSQGIPCIGLAYSMKFSGVFESVGMGDWVIDARDETTASAVAKAAALLATRDQRRQPLADQANQARIRLKTVFTKIASLREDHESLQSLKIANQ